MQELKNKIISKIEKELDDLENTLYNLEEDYYEDYSEDFEEHTKEIFCQDFIEYQNELFRCKRSIETNLDYLKDFKDEETWKKYNQKFRDILYRTFTPEQINTIIYYDDNL